MHCKPSDTPQLDLATTGHTRNLLFDYDASIVTLSLLNVITTGMGTGLSFLNNLGQLVIALGGKSNSQAVFVSLFSVSSCAGRLLLGYGPPHPLELHNPLCWALTERFKESPQRTFFDLMTHC